MFAAGPVSRAEGIGPCVTAGAGGSMARTPSVNTSDRGLFPLHTRTSAIGGGRAPQSQGCSRRSRSSAAGVAYDGSTSATAVRPGRVGLQVIPRAWPVVGVRSVLRRRGVRNGGGQLVLVGV